MTRPSSASTRSTTTPAAVQFSAASPAILDAVTQALASMTTAPLGNPAAVTDQLTEQARILETRHL